MASDASEVDDEDYFSTLPAQTLFLVCEKGVAVMSDYSLVISALNNDFFEAGKVIKEFVSSGKDREQVFGLLLRAKNELHEKTTSTTKERHENWFVGQDAQCNTKEEAMRRRSQDRIRGYFYKFKDEALRSELYKTNPKGKKMLVGTIEFFKYLLAANDYFSCLFDRSHVDRLNQDEIDATKILSKRRRIEIQEFMENDEFLDLADLRKSLCSDLGDFKCFGAWFEPSCTYAGNHTINPYSSRENLILFQTWNLDHQIEFSRSVLPSLLDNVANVVGGRAICPHHKTKAVHISVLTYFKEFFTINNLKLVHIICHDKAGHDLQSNGKIICSKCAEYKFLMRLQKFVQDN